MPRITKSYRVLSLTEAYEDLKKDMDAQKPPAPSRRKRSMSTGGATVKMKPISNEEAMANLRSGKFHEKSLNLSIQELEKAARQRSPLDAMMRRPKKQRYANESKMGQNLSYGQKPKKQRTAPGKFSVPKTGKKMSKVSKAIRRAKAPTKTSATQASSWAHQATRMSKDTNLTPDQSHFHHNVAAHAHQRAAKLHAKLGNATHVQKHRALAKQHSKAAAASPSKNPIETSHYKRR